MILELTILTPRDELPTIQLLQELNKSATQWSEVYIFPTTYGQTENRTCVRFGGGNKRKVLQVLRDSRVRYSRISRLDRPRPPLQMREVNGA